jgi:hypothetical protein
MLKKFVFISVLVLILLFLVFSVIFTYFKARYDSDNLYIWCNSDMVDYCFHNVIFKDVKI